MRLKRLILVLFGILFFTCGCQNIEVGIEATSTPTILPAIESSATPTPLPTVMPQKTTSTPAIEIASYAQETYGFTFQYPTTWEIKQEGNFIYLSQGNNELKIAYKKIAEEISIIPEIQPTPNFSQTGNINFLTQTLSRDAILAENKIVAIYYNKGSEIKVGNLAFTFSLTSRTAEINEIDRRVQEEADKIISSFEATFDLSAPSCSNKATFVQDVTVLDDTRFSPGESFTKTWRLSNSGTCVWTTKYALVFVDGDQMSGQSPRLFTTEVAPGETIDLSVELTAPASNGTYRGNWMLANEIGERFGLGLEANKPFWVQISVGETTPDIKQSLGQPSFTDTLATTNNWFLLNTPNTEFTAGDNSIILKAKNTGETEEWGIANISPIKDFYLELVFKTTEPCSGLDRYGVIVRAPDPNQGYVFGFSCDGRYRLYKWDGKRYQALQEWKNSPHIKSGSGQTNRLGFYAKGNLLKLYANGQLLSEFSDDTFSEGRFGIFIGAEKTNNFTVILEEATYWKLSQ